MSSLPRVSPYGSLENSQKSTLSRILNKLIAQIGLYISSSVPLTNQVDVKQDKRGYFERRCSAGNFSRWLIYFKRIKWAIVIKKRKLKHFKRWQMQDFLLSTPLRLTWWPRSFSAHSSRRSLALSQGKSTITAWFGVYHYIIWSFRSGFLVQTFWPPRLF